MSDKNDLIINLLHNIKSKYILQQIFKNLEYEKKLKIIKYNKKLQEKLNVNVNDYEKYLQIEIEVLFMPISFYILPYSWKFHYIKQIL